MPPTPVRPRATLLAILLLWVAFYASFTLFTPPLLDDADSVHAEVAREMLLRHDYVTLYADGIRYLEKAPLLYWSMALSMKLAMLFGAHSPDALAAAARFPVALDVLGLALVVEALARGMFRSARAGLYAALITLSSFGIFIFTRITLPDAGVCLWTALALLAFWRTEDASLPPDRLPQVPLLGPGSTERRCCYGFATACALNVLTKGLIGLVFPIGIILLYLVLTRGITGAAKRVRELHPFTSLLVFLVIAAPWHILAGLANPTQGHPAPFAFVHGHWQVPLPTDGNVRGWFWFYFMNEHLLRYLNLRIPRDYDTSPLWLFWGLCLVWLMPWSAFLFHAVAELLGLLLSALRVRITMPKRLLAMHSPRPGGPKLFLFLWAALPLLFFSLSTRQEYYVLPALPALALLIAGWLASPDPSRGSVISTEAQRSEETPVFVLPSNHPATRFAATVLVIFGTVVALVSLYFVVQTKAPAPNADLASLLAQHPGDYALSMGHFLDLNAQALGLFRLPLALAAISLFGSTLAHFLLRRKHRPHAATLSLAAGAFGFLLAAHIGLQTFAPVLTSAHLARQIAPQVRPEDLIAIHGEYESGSSLAFYLERPDANAPSAESAIHILEGRSSNLWYGSFFPDAPRIFETPQSLAAKWAGPQRIFLWQATTLPDAPRALALPAPVYVIAAGGGKEILSNQPNR